MLQHDTNGKKKELLIRSPSPLKRSEGSSLLVKTRQSASSPKIDERERRELSTAASQRSREPLATPRPKKVSSVCLLVDNKREKSSWSSPFPLQEREQSSFNRQKNSPQPSTRHEQPCSRPLEQQQSPLRATFGKKTSFTSC